MIQELSGGGGLVQERKFTIPGALLFDHGHSTSSSGAAPSIAPNHPPAMSSSPSSSAENQNLRCPRCDSSNTKFCYYNNYNLTQPRHFCKTCRRYWTKGGALRNVPIGGGCRKSKNPVGSVGGSACKSGGGKVRPDVSNNADAGMAKPSLVGGGGDGFSANVDLLTTATAPIPWASSNGSNYLLSLLKDGNLSTSSDAVRMKEDVSQVNIPDAALVANALSARDLGLEPHTGHAPSTAFCTAPLMWNNNQYQYQHPQVQQQQNNTMLFGTEVRSSGIQELHDQRLNSTTTTTNQYIGDHSQVYMGNVGSSTLLPRATTAAMATATAITTTAAAAVATATATASVMEPIPVTTAGGEFGIWNLPMSWSDVPTTNGGFP